MWHGPCESTGMLARLLLLVCLITSLTSLAQGSTVKALTHIKGEGEFLLRGMGLVVGLPGTGDSGKELAVARPLAAALANSGNAPENLKELAASKAVALVEVTCVIPPGGAKFDDTFDVHVSAMFSGSSIKGGELMFVPLVGPFMSSGKPYAVAAGQIELEDASVTSVGRVRGGARMIREIAGPTIGDSFDLVVAHQVAGYSAATEIAAAINAAAQPQGPGVASVLDPRTIRVVIPEWERKDRAAFIAAVQSAQVNDALLGLPAQVIVNSRSGAIIMTADVEISPVAIQHKDLNITTTTPTPVPTAQNPQVRTERIAGIETQSRPSEKAKLADLLNAFKQLDIPVSERINILRMLHKTGKLHAELIVD